MSETNEQEKTNQAANTAGETTRQDENACCGTDTSRERTETTSSTATVTEAIGKMKSTLADAANSKYAQSAKEKATQLAQSKFVGRVRSKFAQEAACIRNWCTWNWSNGRYGKFRVLAAGLIVIFAIRGLFCGWGTAKSVDLEIEKARIRQAELAKEQTEAQAAAEMFGALLGGGGGSASTSSSRPSGPKTHDWICSRCGRQVHGVVNSPGSVQCGAWRGRNDGTKYCSWRLLH